MPDQFAKTAVIGAEHAWADSANPLRLNFCSTAMRIPFEHAMDLLAPSDQVTRCSWFRAERTDGKPTRRQRVMFAVRGGLTEKFFLSELKIDPKPHEKALLESVDTLSKHVHGRKTTVISDAAEQDVFAQATLAARTAFFGVMDGCRAALVNPIAAALDDAAVDALLYETIDEIDELATHYSIDEICVEDISVHKIDHEIITYRAVGTIAVVLQWGSDSDMRRGDGAESGQSFPFCCDIAVPLDEPGSLESAEPTYSVDVGDWYDEGED